MQTLATRIYRPVWHPLKVAGLLYILGDIGLFMGGIGNDNWLIAVSGPCGLLGSAALLLGGSGAKDIDCGVLEKVAPYAERLSIFLYFLQYVTFGLSGLLLYETIIGGEVLAGMLGVLGCAVGVWATHDWHGWKPYQLAGALWLLSGWAFIWSAFETGNNGVLVSSICLSLGAICVMLSHRAEFAKVH